MQNTIMDKFVLRSEYAPIGDQPQAIEALVKGFRKNRLCGMGNKLGTVVKWRSKCATNNTRFA